MKTFLPIISPTGNPWQTMRLSLECLDNQRLGKQRVESYQIYNVIMGISGGKAWRSSPAVHMCTSHERASRTEHPCCWSELTPCFVVPAALVLVSGYGYPQALGIYIKINCDLWANRLSKGGEPFSNAKMLDHISRCGFGKNDAGEDVAARAMQQANDANAAAADVAAAVVVPAGLSVAGAAAAPRAGKYVNGVRVPWWFDNIGVHESDAAILHQKNPGERRIMLES